MKKSTYFAAGLLLPTLMGATQQTSAQDPAKLAPKNVKVRFENYRVRVLEVRIQPGEKIPMHSHPAHLTYTFSDFKGKYASPDGQSTVGEAKHDNLYWSEPITHASENTGTTEVHALVIELKEPPKRQKEK